MRNVSDIVIQQSCDMVSRRGYTGHTVLGTLGLNHMNGRVQDAVTGRFLSADPYLSEPANTQNYNRYSYAYNNPLSYTDPSGFDNVNGVTVTAYVSYISNITISGIYNFNSFNGLSGLAAIPPSNPPTNSSDASNQQGSVESSGILEEQEVRAHDFGMEVNWATPLAGNLRFSLFPTLGVAGVTVQKRVQTQKTDCNTSLPDGNTVGDTVRDQRAKLDDVENADFNNGGFTGFTFLNKLAAFFGIAQSNGPIDFKNNFRGQGNARTLGDAGNFAYYATGSGYLPNTVLDAGAGAYALYSAARGQKQFSQLTGPMFSDQSAARMRNPGLNANGCSK